MKIRKARRKKDVAVVIVLNADEYISMEMAADVSRDDEQRRYTALHHQLAASAKAVKLAHEIDSENKVGCMLLSRIAYLYTCRPDDVLKGQQTMGLGVKCGDTVHVMIEGTDEDTACDEIKKFFEENL